MISLKPCPFCGSSRISVRGATVFYVVCLDCETSSGCYTDRQEAIAAWNNRRNEQHEKENTDD